MPLSERDVNIPRKVYLKTPPTSKSPQPSSKLPRRVKTTSNSAPSPTPSNSHVNGCSAPSERTAMEARKLSGNNRHSANLSSDRKSPPSTTTDKPLPSEKPLPARPIARLSNALSPSKDSRSLIDASEKPLRVRSIIGEKHEWPALKPEPSRATSEIMTPKSDTVAPNETPSSPVSFSADAEIATLPAATSASTVTTERKTDSVEDQTNSASPPSSYVSALERNSFIRTDCKPEKSTKEAQDDSSSTRSESLTPQAPSIENLPARQASLRNRISSGSLVTPSSQSTNKLVGFTDFTRETSSSPASTESRPHSPSPASFSRPRPGSAASNNAGLRAMKTASRIPVADTKKATVIDVKKNPSSGPPMPKPGLAPTFGSRWLASPDALKILENGKMRRQLQRTPTGGSTSLRQLRRTSSKLSSGTLASSEDTPSLSHSIDSSPEATLGPNSPVSGAPWVPENAESHEDRFTPDCKPVPNHQREQEAQWSSNATEQDETAQSEIEDDAVLNSKNPPQTSPYAGPLQTIPSQAVLPMEAFDVEQKPDGELTRTLSHLEGKGSPPKTDIDNQTLLQLFGHLKRGFDKNPQTSTAFVENAAAAERFLALGQSGTATTHEVNDQEPAPAKKHASVVDVTEKATEDPKADDQATIAVSKWSESTPSDTGLSPPGESICVPLESAPTRDQQQTTNPKEGNKAPVSIGFPSRIPAKIPTDSPNDAASVISIARRRSSPTLGKRMKPGSVRVAREGLQIAAASFARTTASAESKKTARMPTPNTKTFTIPESTHRGRIASSEKVLSTSNRIAGPKVGNSKALHNGAARTNEHQTLRSRSKSRIMLDKINGLFSGRREKKGGETPPVPRIPEAGPKAKDVEVNGNGSPKLRAAKTPQLPKMPSLSPSSHVALRNNSRGTAQTDDTTLVDSFTVQDQSQSVQDLSEHLINKARHEINQQRKERLLSLAKVLTDSLISAREAQISAETAQHAAKSAQLYYEMTQKSLGVLQRLAGNVVHGGGYKRR